MSAPLAARAEARFGGAAGERGGAAVVEGLATLGGGAGTGLVWHIDAFGRRTRDQRAPRHTPLEDGVALEETDRVSSQRATTYYELYANGVHVATAAFEVGEARARLMSGAPLRLDLGLTIDQVRGDNLTAGEQLPRIAPLRARLARDVARGSLRGGLVVRHAARQDRVPATDAATPGYTMLDLWAMAPLPLPGEASLIARLGNVTDRLGYNATAIATARGLTPLPGRAASIALRWRW